MPGRAFRVSVFAGLVLVTAAGCATSKIHSARACFYAGDLKSADAALTEIPSGDTDRILFHMERGMIRQALGQYDSSIRDWQEAVKLEEKLDYYSVSKGSASYWINDQVLAFRGMPYERVMLHTLSAQSYMALSMWSDAAVEARNIIYRLEHIEDYPDDPYGRYVAAFCLEMMGDEGGASFQYKAASGLLNGLKINERTGHIAVSSANIADTRAGPDTPRTSAELVCFVSIGRFPSDAFWWESNSFGKAPYMEIYAEGRLLGRSYPFINTGHLMAVSRNRLAGSQLLKDTARIAVKDVTADAVARHNEFLGELLRLILFSLEEPDTRAWETLPLWLEVARVPCPPDLKNYTAVFKDGDGRTLHQTVVAEPLSRRGNTYVSFCRDLPRIESGTKQEAVSPERK